MRRSLRVRVERLERLGCVSTKRKAPPLFWDALCGAVPLEEVDPQTRRLLEPSFEGRRNAPDPLEEAIREVGSRDAASTHEKPSP